MNKLALVGASLAVLVCATVAVAATPNLSASSPSTVSGSSGSATAGQQARSTTWTADVNPVNIKGNATVTKNADGTGLVTLTLTGVINDTTWTVDIEPGSIDHPNSGVTIASKQGSDVKKVAPDQIQVKLTKDEMDAFAHALTANPAGVTIFVSDGHRLSAATVTASQP